MTNLANLLLDGVSGATFISIDTMTMVKTNKTVRDEAGNREANPHHNAVTKHTVGTNVMVFQNKNSNAYENMVRRRMDKEGLNPESFHLSPRTWGTRIPNTCFIEYNGKFYVEVITIHAGHSQYFYRGKKIDKNAIIEPVKTGSREESQGGIRDKVIINTYSVDSITAITINGRRHDRLTFDPKPLYEVQS